MPDEILVDLKCAVWSFDRSEFRPSFSILLFSSRPLLEEQDISGHVRSGVGPERGIRQTKRAEQYRPIRKVAANS